MKSQCVVLTSRRLAVLVLASATVFPVWAQQTQPSAAGAASSSAQQQPSAATMQPLTPPKEGFWGRINPFASKKWVKRQTTPINDRLTELDEVNARNAQQIEDVNTRAQAGIAKAQAAADTAASTANTANQEAMSAGSTAQQAASHVDQLNATVNGLDQYQQVSALDLSFRGATPELTEESCSQLDTLAASLTGREGYVLEIQAYAPGAGSVGMERSQRLAEAVERYLVTKHQIPIYRMHAVAMGNAQPASADGTDQKPEKKSLAHLRLMENSLAATAASSPQSASAASGAGQP